MIPGIISGSSTLKNALSGGQPRSIAASARDLSICCSLGSTCRITYGRQNVTWAMSIVRKLRLVEAPKSLPTNTNISIREIPVIISGFVIGIFVTVSIAVLYHRLRSLLMPTDAIVPRNTDIAVAENASTSEFLSASSVFASLNSSLYHFSEKPVKTERLLPSLNENIRSMIIGVNRKANIMAV